MISPRKTGRTRTTFWRHNGLSLALAALFVGTWGLGQFFSGQQVYNDDRRDLGLPPLGVAEYFTSAHFAEATMENWESEFFQMGIYVFITTFLFQKGSAESRDPDALPPQPPPVTPASPWPVKRGGWWLRCYNHSLSLAFLSLFVASFIGHVRASWHVHNETEIAHGRGALSFMEFMHTAQFWFESFQNWQSEFLAILAMVVLSIFLREKGSPESKPVAMPHSEME